MALMADSLQNDNGFHPNQATVDGFIDNSIDVSVTNFTTFAVEPNTLQLEDITVEDTLTLDQKTSATSCYEQKVRLRNVFRLADCFSDYIELMNCLELYSDSTEGGAEGCNTFQTQHHRATKIKAISEFKKALREGLKRSLTKGQLSETYVKAEVDDVLSRAEVTETGDSRAGSLTIDQLKGRIYDIGNRLNCI